jgi:hypothetical protein
MEILPQKPPNKLKYPWQRPVFNALVAYESAHLPERVIAADCAIVSRLLQNPMDLEELSALRDSFSALRLIYPVGQT